MGGLEAEKHAKYILTVEKRKDDLESLVMDHLRTNGAYWGLSTLDLLHKIGTVNPDEVVSWVMSCQHQECGGFGGNVGHDPHLLYTLSAVQILALLDRLDVLDIEKVSDYVSGLQNEDGSFSGDMWGEIDTRFSYIAICCLAILRRLDKINVGKAVEYIVSCKNLDGGFGSTPGGESHAGQIFCCVGALAITGYPAYLVHGVVITMQDRENGGISDGPDNAVDVYHTFFGLAGLSLMEYPGLKSIDPAYALPVDVVNRIFFGKSRIA